MLLLVLVQGLIPLSFTFLAGNVVFAVDVSQHEPFAPRASLSSRPMTTQLCAGSHQLAALGENVVLFLAG